MNPTFERLIVWIIAAIVVAILLAWLIHQFGADGIGGSFLDIFKQGDQTIDQLG